MARGEIFEECECGVCGEKLEAEVVNSFRDAW